MVVSSVAAAVVVARAVAAVKARARASVAVATAGTQMLPVSVTTARAAVVNREADGAAKPAGDNARRRRPPRKPAAAQ